MQRCAYADRERAVISKRNIRAIGVGGGGAQLLIAGGSRIAFEGKGVYGESVWHRARQEHMIGRMVGVDETAVLIGKRNIDILRARRFAGGVDVVKAGRLRAGLQPTADAAEWHDGA